MLQWIRIVLLNRILLPLGIFKHCTDIILVNFTELWRKATKNYYHKKVRHTKYVYLGLGSQATRILYYLCIPPHSDPDEINKRKRESHITGWQMDIAGDSWGSWWSSSLRLKQSTGNRNILPYICALNNDDESSRQNVGVGMKRQMQF